MEKKKQENEKLEKREREFTSYSGTKQYEEKTINIWENLFLDYEYMNEELYGDTKSDVETLDHFFMDLKEAPAYRYAIVRLCNDLALPYDTADYVKMFTEIENGRERSRETEEILTKLASFLSEQYEENVRKAAPPMEVLKEKLLHFDKEFLLSFLIWSMDYESDLIEGFLTAVLGGQGFDYYDAEQFLTYMTFAYQYKGSRSRYDVFVKLKELYMSLEPTSGKIKKPVGTMAIRETADGKLKSEPICLDGEVTPELIRIMQWHKELKTPAVRTIGKKYTELMEEVPKLYYNEIQNFLWNYEKIQEMKLEEQFTAYLDTFQNISLTVTYDGAVDPNDKAKSAGSNAAVFKKGTALYGENFVFTVEKDIEFPRMEVIREVPIPVAAISAHPVPGNHDTLPSDVSLMLCDKDGIVNEAMMDKFKVKVYTFPTKEKKQTRWRSLAKPAYNFKCDGGKGYVLVDAAPGFEVKGGETFFSYVEDGIQYLYMVRKDAQFLCKKDIAPYYKRSDVLDCYRKESSQLEMAPGDIKRVVKQDGGLAMEPSKLSYHVVSVDRKNGLVEGIENIIGIYNKKPVIYKDDVIVEKLTEEEMLRAISKSQAPLLIDMEYPVNCEVHLKKGTRFTAKKYLKKDTFFGLKGNEQNQFILLQDMVLPASNRRTVAVEVVSLDQESRPGVKEKFLNEKAKVYAELGENASGAIIEIAFGELPKPRLYCDGKPGYLYVTCECGTILDQTTRFIAEMKGQQYVFVPVKEKIEVNKEFVLYENIPVYVDEQKMYMLSTSESGKHQGEHVLTRANTYFEMEESAENLKIGKIIAKERYLWNPNIEDKAVDRAAFLSYLYSLIDYEYFEKYLPKLRLENLSVEWFRKMLIQNWTEEEFCHLPKDQARSVLMTLTFLKAAKEKEIRMANDKKENIHGRLCLEEGDFLAFERSMDEVMGICRMDDFYMGNPCDCLLAYLYICDSPVDALRMLFKFTKGRS